MHAELRRKGVTLALLWEEYSEGHPDGYGYNRYWRQASLRSEVSGAFVGPVHSAEKDAVRRKHSSLLAKPSAICSFRVFPPSRSTN